MFESNLDQLFNNNVNQKVLMDIINIKFSVSRDIAYIMRLKSDNKNAGNFFNEEVSQERDYIETEICVSRQRDDSAKASEELMENTEELEVMTRGKHYITETDYIYYKGNIYKPRDIQTQKFGTRYDNEVLFQKFNIVYVQKANDYPTSSYP